MCVIWTNCGEQRAKFVYKTKTQNEYYNNHKVIVKSWLLGMDFIILHISTKPHKKLRQYGDRKKSRTP